MKSVGPAIATALFIPAILGLAAQVWAADALPQSLLSLALLLLAPEQAHMAGADLRQIALVEHRQPDARLRSFRNLVWGTIAGQLAGFYLAAIGFLGSGMLVILMSLVGFNLLAPIQLEPGAKIPIRAATAHDRLAVLALNGVAGILAIVGVFNIGPLWSACGILAIVTVYLGSKLAAYAKAWYRSRRSSSPHIPDSIQQHP